MKRQVDKALVLVGGSGTRLRPFTYSITKQLLPIANKPVLFYILEKVRALGVREIGLVVSAPHAKETIRIVGDGSRWDARFTYLVQEEPRGLADTVRISREFLGSSSFLMVLGDNVYGFDFAGIVADFLAHPCDGLLVTQRVEEPTRYGIVVVQPDGSVKSVVEKPSEALSDLALLGIYIFSPEIHRVMDSISPSDRGELELTNAVMGVIKAGRMVRHFTPQGMWMDTGVPEDLLRANRFIMDTKDQWEVRGRLVDSQVTGKVEIPPTAEVVGSILRGPVCIGEGCRIVKATLGPYVSIGAGTFIEGAEVIDSIALEGCRVTGPLVIKQSMLGRRVSLHAGGERRIEVRTVLGDDSQIEVRSKGDESSGEYVYR